MAPMRAVLPTTAALLALAALAGRAQPPEPVKSPRVVDPLKPPPGGILVRGGDPRDVLNQPGAVVISADEYRKILDQIEQLKKQIGPDKPEPPTACRLSGKVEARGNQEVARLTAVFEFRTGPGRTVVLLGLR